MTSPPLRIVTNQGFAADLARELDVPHVLKIIKDQSDAEIAHLLSDANILVMATFKAEWRDPQRCALQLVHSTGAGTDWIDFASLPADCKVCNVYGHERGVAEQAFSMVLALQKNFFRLDAALRKGDWTHQTPYLSELRGRNLLVLGLGHVGQELVRWGHFLEMKITVLTRSPTKDRYEKHGLHAIGSLKELGTHLKDADFVIVAIPATKDTVDLIAEKELEQMKPSAFIINVGRAPVINEAALYQALRARSIAGAGLDVWYQYPDKVSQIRLPAQQPFQELDNVIMTPHKPTFETMAYRFGEIAENIRRFARDEPLNCLVPWSRH